MRAPSFVCLAIVCLAASVARPSAAQDCTSGDRTAVAAEELPRSGTPLMRAAARHFRRSIAPTIPWGWPRRLRVLTAGGTTMSVAEAAACIGYFEGRATRLRGMRADARIAWVFLELVHEADGESDYLVFLDERLRVLRDVRMHDHP